MRACFAFFSLLVVPSFVSAQDNAAAQARQATHEAAMPAMQNAAEASRQASEAAEQAMQNSMNSVRSAFFDYIDSTVS
jgi:type II secretory pathway pseudopilin PulG